jgi:hypothetical protein
MNVKMKLGKVTWRKISKKGREERQRERCSIT